MPSQVGTQSCSLSALPSRPGPGVGGIRCCTWSARAAASQCEAQRPGGRRVGGTYRLVAVNRSPNAQAPSRVKIATPWQNQWQSVSDVHCFLPCTHARADAFPRTRLRCRSGAASAVRVRAATRASTIFAHARAYGSNLQRPATVAQATSTQVSDAIIPKNYEVSDAISKFSQCCSTVAGL